MFSKYLVKLILLEEILIKLLIFNFCLIVLSPYTIQDGGSSNYHVEPFLPNILAPLFPPLLSKIFAGPLNSGAYFFQNFQRLFYSKPRVPLRPHRIARRPKPVETELSRPRPAPPPNPTPPPPISAVLHLTCFFKVGDPVFIRAQERCPSPVSASPAPVAGHRRLLARPPTSTPRARSAAGPCLPSPRTQHRHQQPSPFSSSLSTDGDGGGDLGGD
jgi:hypothetical protein